MEAEKKCRTCKFFVKNDSPAPNNNITREIGQCRCNAPTTTGYPIVYGSGWCGDHEFKEEYLLLG